MVRQTASLVSYNFTPTLIVGLKNPYARKQGEELGAIGYTSGDPRKVDVAGDTMTGDLVLPGDPDAALEAATKQYVDAADALKLDRTGGTVEGNLTVQGTMTSTGNIIVD